jgi:hypothetical protein
VRRALAAVAASAIAVVALAGADDGDFAASKGAQAEAQLRCTGGTRIEAGENRRLYNDTDEGTPPDSR